MKQQSGRQITAQLVLGLLTGILIAGPAFAAVNSTAGGLKISPELKSSNPQALQFEDNGQVIKQTQNMQVNSSGRLVMAASEPAWMGESGVVLDRGRARHLYQPGEISYLKDVHPHVVLAIMSYGAAVFQSTKGAINNPTLILPADRLCTFTVMNFSNGYPGTFTIVRKGPPYPTFINLKEENTVMNSGWIKRTPLSGAYSPYRNVTLTFTRPGTYYYLSLQPGNAQGGQWGKIIVKSAK
nr:rusticyanin-like protein [Acidihalobacter sp.]